METILNSAGQPVVVGDNKNTHHSDCELISCGQMHDEARHNDNSVREHSLFNHSSQERFALRQLDELSDVRRELMDIKSDLLIKISEENHRTRDLIREEQIARMRSEEVTLRAQLIAAGIVPAA